MVKFTVEHTTGALAFHKSERPSPPWWRQLYFDGEPIYRIGNRCETCQALFEKQADARLPLAPAALSQQLRQGFNHISQPVLDTVEAILPAGKYTVALIEITPHMVAHDENLFARPLDYHWQHEPNDPGHALTEVILPLVSLATLQREGIEAYKEQFRNSRQPVSLALSLVDERFISARAYQWALAHFLLDGHHKLMAASELGTPITLLSFLAESESFASPKCLQDTISLRYR